MNSTPAPLVSPIVASPTSVVANLDCAAQVTSPLISHGDRAAPSLASTRRALFDKEARTLRQGGEQSTADKDFELHELQKMTERLLLDVAERDVKIDELTQEAKEEAIARQVLVVRPDGHACAISAQPACLYDGLVARALVALVAFVAILLCP
jgi:hypothetical protein